MAEGQYKYTVLVVGQTSINRLTNDQYIQTNSNSAEADGGTSLDGLDKGTVE